MDRIDSAWGTKVIEETTRQEARATTAGLADMDQEQETTRKVETK